MFVYTRAHVYVHVHVHVHVRMVDAVCACACVLTYVQALTCIFICASFRCWILARIHGALRFAK